MEMLTKLKYLCWEKWNYWHKYSSVLFALLFSLMFIILWVELQKNKPFIALGGSAYSAAQGALYDEDSGILYVSAGDKCNLKDHWIEVTGETVWRRIDVLGDNVPGIKGTSIYNAKECRTDLVFENKVPEKVTSTPGIWEHTGIETARYKGESHTKTWRTEPFEIK